MPAQIVFVVNPPAWNKAFKSWSGSPVGRYMKIKSTRVKTTAMFLAPGPGKPPRNTTGIAYGKGATQSQIITTQHHSKGGDLEGHVVALTKQALFVHEGTKGPYTIRARPGKYLRWRSVRTGGYVYAQKVTHPGIRIKQPFLLEALKRSI